MAGDAIEHAILTFRDADGIGWIRLPEGVLKEQDHDTPRDSVLAALGRPIPAPAEHAATAGQAKEPEAPGNEEGTVAPPP